MLASENTGFDPQKDHDLLDNRPGGRPLSKVEASLDMAVSQESWETFRYWNGRWGEKAHTSRGQQNK